jgi:endonuclease/exonuclease/phosphatase family metal-dependent hydrolase
MLPVALYQIEDSELLSAAGDRPELTVMTTNARYGWTDDYRFDPDPYVHWLQSNPASIIGMQEVNKGNFYGGFIDVFEYYRRQLPGRALYGDANFGFGNALFTDLEVIDSSVTAFASSDMIRRSYIWALVMHAGREIEVFVTHLSHLPHPNEIRQAQVEELVEQLARTERPWILMGDMNAITNDPEIAAFTQVSHPVFRERPELLSEYSYPSEQPRLRLDYIFFSDHFDLVDQEVLDNQGSTDHRPIRSVLRLVR